MTWRATPSSEIMQEVRGEGKFGGVPETSTFFGAASEPLPALCQGALSPGGSSHPQPREENKKKKKKKGIS